jgi:hypothetical protein
MKKEKEFAPVAHLLAALNKFEGRREMWLIVIQQLAIHLSTAPDKSLERAVHYLIEGTTIQAYIAGDAPSRPKSIDKDDFQARCVSQSLRFKSKEDDESESGRPKAPMVLLDVATLRQSAHRLLGFGPIPAHSMTPRQIRIDRLFPNLLDEGAMATLESVEPLH